MKSASVSILFTAALALLLPSPAWAHLVNTGMGPVYDGIGHLLLTPEDLVPVLALSCYCGLRGPKAGRWAMFVLPLAWCAGGLIGLRLDLEITLPVTSLSFLLLGVPVRAARADGSVITFTATCRIDTPVEIEYYRNGGILHTVLRKMA